MRHLTIPFISAVIFLASFDAMAQTQVSKNGVEAKILKYESDSGNYNVEVQNINDYPIKASVQIHSTITESGSGTVCDRNTSKRTVLVKPYESQEIRFSGGCILSMGWGARQSNNDIKLRNVEVLGKPKPEPKPEPKPSMEESPF